MNYAVIKSGGKQYKVTEGEVVEVDRLEVENGAKYTFPEVLLVRNEDQILIGDPYLKEASVVGKILEEVKGDKIHVFKFKSKIRYRRKIGFRPIYTKVGIESISIPPLTRVKK